MIKCFPVIATTFESEQRHATKWWHLSIIDKISSSLISIISVRIMLYSESAGATSIFYLMSKIMSHLIILYIYMSEWASYQIRKIEVTHAPGMPGRFSQPPRVNDPDIHHDTCLTQVPWCMPGSLTSGCHWSGWRGKLSRHSRRTRNPHFNLSCERPMVLLSHYVATRDCCNEIIFSQL